MPGRENVGQNVLTPPSQDAIFRATGSNRWRVRRWRASLGRYNEVWKQERKARSWLERLNERVGLGQSIVLIDIPAKTN
jgi:hypothetical protein